MPASTAGRALGSGPGTAGPPPAAPERPPTPDGSPAPPATPDRPPTPAPPARPLVAVVGRPNVGKSTLVNRIVGRRETIVERQPGVTRDRKPLAAEWAGHEFTIVDTGGWVAGGDRLDRSVSAQSERAVAEAAVVLLVLDVTVGITEDDARVARLLRRSGRPVLVVANKVDGDSRDPDVWALEQLGLGDPHPVSALHGRGSGDLLDAVAALLPAAGAAPTVRPTPTAGPADAGPVDTGAADTGPVDAGAADAGPSENGPADLDRPTDLDRPAGEGSPAPPWVPSVAVVGRPNVGKSTLFNRLVGDERAVVHDLPGTTRDAVDTVVATASGAIRFVDTAGLRRRAREAEAAEYYSLVRALQAIDRADAALLVIDATAGVTRQDQRLAERLDAAGNAVVVVLNKWELLDSPARRDVLAELEDRLAFLAYAPVRKVSARTGLGVHRLVPALREALEAYRRRIPTAELNRVLAEAQGAHRSPHGRVLYATQGATDPPTFTLFTTARLPAPYLRYLERCIRERFALGPTPVKLRVRRRGA